MIYLLKGPERLLLEMQLAKILDENDVNESDVVKFDATENPIEQLIETIDSPSMFFDKQVVVVHHPFFLTGEITKVPFKNDYTSLENYLENPNPDTILVFFANYEKLDTRKNIVKKIEKHAEVFEAKRVVGEKYNQTVQKAIAKRGLNFDHEAFEIFIQLIPEDLGKVVNELDKIKMQGITNIDKESIEKVISQSIEKDVFELSKAIGSKDKSKIMKIYKDIMLQNNMEIALISIIGSQLVLLKQIKEGLDKKMSHDQIAKEFGKNPFIVKMNAGVVRTIDGGVLKELIDDLTILDYSIKTGKVDKELGLDIFMLKLISKI